MLISYFNNNFLTISSFYNYASYFYYYNKFIKFFSDNNLFYYIYKSSNLSFINYITYYFNFSSLVEKNNYISSLSLYYLNTNKINKIIFYNTTKFSY
eukprot:TRINITY_DN64835_c0_g1_i2.p1 TRINITY_DN64835_c0_g1~~TRINITY_DN64835_c0_g1_i2.p1  ORF type:complete len:110 (+),score=1.61 TRINITY_DN64835_c0_g1_i2:42-332(+)